MEENVGKGKRIGSFYSSFSFSRKTYTSYIREQNALNLIRRYKAMYGLPPEAIDEIACVAVDESSVMLMAKKYNRDPQHIKDIATTYSDFRSD